MKLLLIYNAHAAHDRAGKIMNAVMDRFHEKGVDCDLQQTTRQGHGIDLTFQADLDAYNGVVAAGGDGTLFEVITGYFRNGSKKPPPLGVLPIGTGNAFARDMGDKVPSWEEAVEIIVQGKTRQVDVGQFETGGTCYHFLNILGLGFVADVVKIADRLKWMGNLSYTVGVLNRTLFLKAIPIRLEIDDQTLERENIFVEISNTRYTSNFYMAPNAQIDDGFLDVTLLGKMSRRKLLSSFPKIFTGEHIYLPEVEQVQARRIHIQTPNPKPLSPDGELVGSTPFTVECLRKAVEVFWP